MHGVWTLWGHADENSFQLSGRPPVIHVLIFCLHPAVYSPIPVFNNVYVLIGYSYKLTTPLQCVDWFYSLPGIGLAPEGSAPRDLLPRVALAWSPVPPRAQAVGHLRVPLQLQADGGLHQPLPLQAGGVARHAARPGAPPFRVCARYNHGVTTRVCARYRQCYNLSLLHV